MQSIYALHVSAHSVDGDGHNIQDERAHDLQKVECLMMCRFAESQ